MSKQIDEHVVEMRFNNEQFEKKANKTMATLDNLKSKLNFENSAKQVEKLNDSVRNVNFNPLTQSIETVGVKMSALQTISDQVWRNITNTVTGYAKKLVHAVNAPLNQIVVGGKKRAQNIANAKFQLEGLGVAWDKIEEDINYGVKDTAYGLDSAAKAASQLVASQVELGDEMKSALRGISGVAAMTNSEYDDIAHIFTTVAGQGKLMSMQLNQIAGRGLNVASTLAKALGTTEADIRDMVSKGKIDFKTFSKAMDDAFGEHAKDANKTFEGSLSNVKAALARTGVDVAASGFEGLRKIFVSIIPVINNFNKAIKPLTGAISEGIERFTDVTVVAVSKINELVTSTGLSQFLVSLSSEISYTTRKVSDSIREFIKLDGVQDILIGIVNAVRGVIQVLRAIKFGIRDAFSNANKKGLNDAAKRFRNFTESLWMSADAQLGLSKVITLMLKPLSWLMDGIRWILDFVGPAIQDIHDFVDAILSYIGMPDSYTNPLEKIFGSKLLEVIKDKFPKAIESVESVIKSVKDTVVELYTKLKELPQMKRLINDIQDAFANLLSGILDGVSNLSGIDLSKTISIDGFVDMIGKAIDKIYEWKDNLKAIFSPVEVAAKSVDNATKSIEDLGGNLKKLDDKVPAIFKKGANGEKKTGFFEGIKAQISGLKETTKTVLKPVEEFIDGLSAGTIILGTFGVGINALIISIVGLVRKISKFIGGLEGLLKGITTAIKDFAGSFKMLMTSIGKSVKMMGTAAVIKSIAFAIISLAAAVAVLAFIPAEQLEQSVNTLVKIIASLGGLLLVAAIINKLMGDNLILNLAKSLGAMALGFAFLGIALFAISKIGDSDLEKALDTMWSLFWILSALTAVAAIFTNFAASEGNFLAPVGVITSLALAMITMSLALKIISTIPTDKIEDSLIAITSIIAVFGGVTTLMLFVAKGVSLKSIAVISSFIAGLIILTGLALVLAAVPTDYILKGVYNMLPMFVGIYVLAKLAEKTSEHADKLGKAILSMAIAFGLMALAVKIISSIPEEELKKIEYTVAYLFVMIAGFAALSTFLSHILDVSKVKDVGIAVAAMAGGFILLAGALKIISTIDPESLWDSVTALSIIILTFSAMAVAVAFASKNMQGVKWAPIVAMAAAVGILATSLAVLAFVSDPEKLKAAGLTILFGMVGMAAYMLAVSKMAEQISTKGLISMILAIGAVATMGYALFELSKMDPGNILFAGLALAGCLIALAEALVMIASVKEMSINNLLAIIMIAGASYVIAQGLSVIAKALVDMASVPWNQLLIAAGVLALMGVGIGIAIKIISANAPAMVEAAVGIAAFGASLIVVAAAIALFAVAGLAGAKAIDILANTFMTFVNQAPMLLASLIMAVNEFVLFLKTLAENAEEIGKYGAEIGINFVLGLIEGFSEGLAKLAVWPVYVARAIVDGLKEALGIHSPSTKAMEIAGFFLQGLIKGLSDSVSLQNLGKSIKNLARNIVDGLKKHLGIHSPSKEAEEIGAYFDQGLVNGLEKNKGGISNSLSGIKSMFTDMKLDDLDVTPTITPVMDLSNVESGVGDINGLLGSSNIGGSVNLAGNVTSDFDNEGFQRLLDRVDIVIDRIDRSAEKLDKISSMKVVLDDNTLVGKMTPKINKALGSKVTRSNTYKHSYA